MFNNRKRVDAAFAKGLMFGKAVGARDERDRIVAIFEEWSADQGINKDLNIHQLIKVAVRKHND